MMARARAVALAVSGAGLILLGIAAYFFIPWMLSVQDTVKPTDLSAVPAQVHFNAPNLTLTDLAGTQHSLADYKGQVVLVNLWATWCPPCKAEMPELQAFFDHHQSEGFMVIAIDDGDPAADVRTFTTNYQLSFPIWLDPTYQATDHAFRTGNLPSSYVIDRQGVVRLAWVGAINASNLEKYVTPLIRE